MINLAPFIGLYAHALHMHVNPIIISNCYYKVDKGKVKIVYYHEGNTTMESLYYYCLDRL